MRRLIALSHLYDKYEAIAKTKQGETETKSAYVLDTWNYYFKLGYFSRMPQHVKTCAVVGSLFQPIYLTTG